MDAKIRSTKCYMFTKGIEINANNHWLQNCVQWFVGENSSASINELHSFVYDQFLLADLRDVQLNCLPTNISDQNKLMLEGKYTLQVDSTQDVSQSCYSQIQIIRGTGKNTNVENQDARSRNHAESEFNVKSSHMLKLNMTDGVQQVFGMEYGMLSQIREGFIPGCKVVISGPVEVRRGVFFLKPVNFHLLGGELDSIIIQNSVENVLARILNLNENPNAGPINIFNNLTNNAATQAQPSQRPNQSHIGNNEASNQITNSITTGYQSNAGTSHQQHSGSSNQQSASSHQQSASSHQHSASSHQQSASSHQQSASSHQQSASTYQQSASTYQQSASTYQQSASTYQNNRNSHEQSRPSNGSSINVNTHVNNVNSRSEIDDWEDDDLMDMHVWNDIESSLVNLPSDDPPPSISTSRTGSTSNLSNHKNTTSNSSHPSSTTSNTNSNLNRQPSNTSLTNVPSTSSNQFASSSSSSSNQLHTNSSNLNPNNLSPTPSGSNLKRYPSPDLTPPAKRHASSIPSQNISPTAVRVSPPRTTLAPPTSSAQPIRMSLARIKTSPPPLPFSMVFRGCKVKSMEKLSVSKGTWKLPATITDDQVEFLSVDFSDPVIFSISGVSAAELQSKKKQVTTDPQLRKTLEEMVQNIRTQIFNYEGPMKISFTSSQKPTVVALPK